MINFDDEKILTGKTDAELLEEARVRLWMVALLAAAGWLILIGVTWASLR